MALFLNVISPPSTLTEHGALYYGILPKNVWQQWVSNSIMVNPIPPVFLDHTCFKKDFGKSLSRFLGQECL